MTSTNSPPPGSPRSSSFARSLAVYLDPRMIVILLLGFSSGLPFALSFTTLSVWFAEVGVRKTDIGLFVLVQSRLHLEVPLGSASSTACRSQC